MASSIPFLPVSSSLEIPDISSYQSLATVELPNRPYFNMRLEDYEPYKALGEPIALHGPAPYRPTHCGCDRYRVAVRMCVCSMDCKTKPLWAWAQANPEAFQKKQNEMRRWKYVSDLWWKQKDAVTSEWDQLTRHVRFQFMCLQDDESPIGCAQCERDNRDYCKCACEGCGSKMCSGCYEDDGEY